MSTKHLDLITIIVVALAIIVPQIAHAAIHPEKHYQQIWCDHHQGKTEVKMPDRTRIDCLTATHAIEFDFARKWAESIGQSLGYAFMTNKRAGIVLIIETQKDVKHWYKLLSVIQHNELLIDVWCVGSGPLCLALQ